jgi:hypothetical protein
MDTVKFPGRVTICCKHKGYLVDTFESYRINTNNNPWALGVQAERGRRHDCQTYHLPLEVKQS